MRCAGFVWSVCSIFIHAGLLPKIARYKMQVSFNVSEKYRNNIMNLSQWFWKYGYILIVPVALLFFWFDGSEERNAQAHVNPAVFISFDKIESDCNAEEFDKQSALCTQIYQHKKECTKVTVRCNSLTYYDFLKDSGFDLPPYYQEGFNSTNN